MRYVTVAVLAFAVMLFALDSPAIAQSGEFDPQTLIGVWKGRAENVFVKSHPVYLRIKTVAGGKFRGVVYLAVKQAVRSAPARRLAAYHDRDVQISGSIDGKGLSFTIPNGGPEITLTRDGSILRGQGVDRVVRSSIVLTKVK